MVCCLRYTVAAAMGHAEEWCTDEDGAWIVCSLLRHAAPGPRDELVAVVAARAAALSTHAHGCQVVCRALEAGSAEQRAAIVAPLLPRTLELGRHPVGSWAVLWALDFGTPGQRDTLLAGLWPVLSAELRLLAGERPPGEPAGMRRTVDFFKDGAADDTSVTWHRTTQPTDW